MPKTLCLVTARRAISSSMESTEQLRPDFPLAFGKDHLEGGQHTQRTKDSHLPSSSLPAALSRKKRALFSSNPASATCRSNGNVRINLKSIVRHQVLSSSDLVGPSRPGERVAVIVSLPLKALFRLICFNAVSRKITTYFDYGTSLHQSDRGEPDVWVKGRYLHHLGRQDPDIISKRQALLCEA